MVRQWRTAAYAYTDRRWSLPNAAGVASAMAAQSTFGLMNSRRFMRISSIKKPLRCASRIAQHLLPDERRGYNYRGLPGTPG